MVLFFRNEIEDLEHKVARERERYQISTQSMSDGISAIPMMPVNDSVCLNFIIINRGMHYICRAPTSSLTYFMTYKLTSM